jgi:hypothetical protein
MRLNFGRGPVAVVAEPGEKAVRLVDGVLLRDASSEERGLDLAKVRALMVAMIEVLACRPLANNSPSQRLKGK